jgi:hypothetical protein
MRSPAPTLNGIRSATVIAAGLAAALIVVLGGAGRAEARAVHYRSQHPLPRNIGHGFCYIGVPHVHDFGPSDARLYREVNGELYFVGDPSPFAYEGPHYAFYGPHPVVEADVQFGQPVYCYLDGPHSHWYQPAASAPFEFRGGAYWYVGNYDPVYYQERPRYLAVNQFYQTIEPRDYARPVVDVTLAPPSFHGEILVGPGYRHAHAVVAPPVISAGVTIAVPPPPQVQVGIGIGFGGPPVVVEDRREIYDVRERHEHHHDHGWDRHERDAHGWRGAPPGPPSPRGGGWRAPPPGPVRAQGGGWRGGPPAAPAARKDQHPPSSSHSGGGWRR